MTTTQDNMTIVDLDAIAAENIRGLAARRGETQTSLARKIGQAQSTVSQKYWGKRTWSLEDLAKVAAVLGVEPWELTTPPGYATGPYREIGASTAKVPTRPWYTVRDSNPEPTGLALALVLAA